MLKKSRVRGEMKPLSVREVRTIESILATKERWRDLALFRLGIDSLLRASDLVRIYVDEITDHNGKIVTRAELMMKKTKRKVKFAISTDTAEAVRRWIDTRPAFSGEWLFPGREAGDHLSEVQYRKLAKGWFAACGLDVRRYSTHSLRRTKAAEVYRQTHNIEAVSRLLGHTTVTQTSRYLGIQDEDALDLAEKVKI